MKAKTKNRIEMGQGSILRGLYRFAAPLALANVMQLLFVTTDMIVIGRFGRPNALGAVGASGQITSFFLSAIIGLGTAATVIASTCLGARHSERVKVVVHVTMTLASIIGIAAAFIVGLSLDWLIQLARIPQNVAPDSKIYLQCIIPSLPASVVFNYGASLLRAKGDTRRPLYFLVTAGVVNVVLNLYFVISLQMNVAGIGIATAIASYISCGLLIACLMREKDEFRFAPNRMLLNRRIVWQLFRIGIPNSIQATVFSLSNFIIAASVNGFGATVMNGSAAAQRIEGYIHVCMHSVALAAMSFVSFNTGAGNYRRVFRTTFSAAGLALATGLVLGVASNIFGKELLHIFTDDPESIAQGLYRLHLICGFYGLCGVMDCFAYSIRGMGYSLLPAVISMLGACGFRILWIATLFSLPAFHSVFWLFMTYPVSWGITILAYLVCFFYVFRKLATRTSSPTSPAAWH